MAIPRSGQSAKTYFIQMNPCGALQTGRGWGEGGWGVGGWLGPRRAQHIISYSRTAIDGFKRFAEDVTAGIKAGKD